MNKVLCIVVVLLAHSILWANIEGGVSLTTTVLYDNNVIQLSKMYIDEFVDNTKPERYSISSIDDLVIEASLTAGSSVSYAGGWKSGITLTCSGDFFTGNKVCNGYYLKGVFYQRIPNLFWVYFRYQYTPYNYVADYYIEDKGYKSMTYGKEDFSLSVRRKLSKYMTLGVNGAYGKSLYNKYFIRYDNRKWLLGGDIETSFKRFEFDAGYSYEVSTKIDRVTNYSKDSTTDGSYREHTVDGGIKIKLPKSKKFSHYISSGYVFELRNYTSGTIEDIYHKERVDVKNSLRLAYCTTIVKRLNIDIYCISTFRQTNSGIYSKLADEKSFSQIQAGIKISSDLKWK